MKEGQFALGVLCLLGLICPVGISYADEPGALAVHATRGDIVACASCLKSGSLIDAPAAADPLRRTPLMLASMNGHLPVVNLLLAHEARVDARDADRATALFYASENGHLEVARVLIEAHASIEARDRFGDRPLFAATRENRPELVDLLLAAGADPFQQSLYSGDTPLTLARRLKHTVAERMLRSATAIVLSDL